MLKKFRFAGLLALVLALSVGLTACGNSSSSKGGSKNGLGKKNITLASDNYVSATASTYVMKAILENLGYTVKVKQVDVGPMFAGVAGGSADATLAVWLPHTHASYWKKYKNRLDKLGVNMNSVPLGLVVPGYVKINSIKDLKNDKNNIGEKTNWTITGISAGAGEMIETKNKVMPAYGLNKKWHLQTSSGPAMTAALKKAISNHKPIIVTLWDPHWAFLKWHLKYLKDPKNKYGNPDDIYTVTRKGLKKDSPAAYKVLKQFHWTKKDDEKVMLNLQKGMDPSKAGKQFVKKHQKLVKKWTKGVKAAKGK